MTTEDDDLNDTLVLLRNKLKNPDRAYDLNTISGIPLLKKVLFSMPENWDDTQKRNYAIIVVNSYQSAFLDVKTQVPGTTNDMNFDFIHNLARKSIAAHNKGICPADSMHYLTHTLKVTPEINPALAQLATQGFTQNQLTGVIRNYWTAFHESKAPIEQNKSDTFAQTFVDRAFKREELDILGSEDKIPLSERDKENQLAGSVMVLAIERGITPEAVFDQVDWGFRSTKVLEKKDEILTHIAHIQQSQNTCQESNNLKSSPSNNSFNIGDFSKAKAEAIKKFNAGEVDTFEFDYAGKTYNATPKHLINQFFAENKNDITTPAPKAALAYTQKNRLERLQAFNDNGGMAFAIEQRTQKLAQTINA